MMILVVVKDRLPYASTMLYTYTHSSLSGACQRVYAHIRQVCLNARLRTGLCGLLHCPWYMYTTVNGRHHVNLDHWRESGPCVCKHAQSMECVCVIMFILTFILDCLCSLAALAMLTVCWWYQRCRAPHWFAAISSTTGSACMQ